MAATNPAWRSKPHLTLIPEDAFPISYRFNVVLVGATAKDFARIAVETEFAEAYRPKGQKASGLQNDQEAGHSSEEDALVFFCPTGFGTRELARLRLQPCVSFSQSLPMSRDRATAMNTVVALLFWQVGHKPHPEGAASEAIGDFQSRVMEIQHLPVNLRPYTALLAFEASESQEKQLNDFVGRQQVRVIPSFYSGDAEDVVPESLQTLCENAIKHQSRASVRVASTVFLDASKGQQSCCVIA
mmetsp:Transcript_90948/g.294346  ORF Transcript_90948/g.294346 Transcript_90948/m.294346 type:complete len:243 (-) Transcript_90948:257-985(-)